MQLVSGTTRSGSPISSSIFKLRCLLSHLAWHLMAHLLGAVYFEKAFNVFALILHTGHLALSTFFLICRDICYNKLNDELNDLV
jgi:hypothetical protein